MDSIEKVPAIIDYLPQTEDAVIVLAGYLPSDKKKALVGNHDCAVFTLMPFSMREYAGLAPNPLGATPVPLRITYPLPGFFDVMRNGFMPREDRALSSSAFYEKWLADFFARHVKGVMNTYKDTLFFRFMQVLADHNMQELNHSKFAKEAGISYATAIYWTDFLVDCGVLLEVPSMKLSERRQVKRSKLIYADTGLLSFLLGCATGDELYSHPAYLGVLQGFAAAEIVKNYAALGEKAPIFFYRDTISRYVGNSNEIDFATKEAVLRGEKEIRSSAQRADGSKINGIYVSALGGADYVDKTINAKAGVRVGMNFKRLLLEVEGAYSTNAHTSRSTLSGKYDIIAISGNVGYKFWQDRNYRSYVAAVLSAGYALQTSSGSDDVARTQNYGFIGALNVRGAWAFAPSWLLFGEVGATLKPEVFHTEGWQQMDNIGPCAALGLTYLF